MVLVLCKIFCTVGSFDTSTQYYINIIYLTRISVLTKVGVNVKVLFAFKLTHDHLVAQTKVTLCTIKFHAYCL